MAWFFVFRPDAPSKKLPVEAAGGLLPGGAQIRHAKRPWNSLDAETPVPPQAESRTRGVLENSHSPHVEHIQRRGNFAPSSAAREKAAPSFSNAR